jgi:hypothetical protein
VVELGIRLISPAAFFASFALRAGQHNSNLDPAMGAKMSTSSIDRRNPQRLAADHRTSG